MIKINLAGKGKSAKGLGFLSDLEARGVSVKWWAIVIVLLYGGKYYIADVRQKEIASFDKQINEYTQKIQTVTTKAAKYRSLKGTIEKVQAEKAAVEAKLAAMNKLVSGRELPVKMLETISNLLPPQVWFTDFSFKGKTQISIKGLSTEFSFISDFHKAMGDSIFFDNIVLGSTRSMKDTMYGGTIESFDMSARFKPSR